MQKEIKETTKIERGILIEFKLKILMIFPFRETMHIQPSLNF